MTDSIRRNVLANLILTGRYLWRRRGLWLRAGLSLLVGLVFISFDREQEYDLRFQLRGPQKVNDEIVLIHIGREEWRDLHKPSTTAVPLASSNSFSDGSYWNEELWKLLLQKLLNEKSKIIGVNLYFGANIESPSPEALTSTSFRNRSIFWATLSDRDGHVLSPHFARSQSRNTGLGEVEPDRDGFIRRISSHNGPLPLLALQMAKSLAPKNDSFDLPKGHTIINFRGPHGTYPSLSIKDVLNNQFPEQFFKNKIVLIGGDDSLRPRYRTPVGDLNLSELNANIIDNFISQSWIQRAHPLFIFLILLLFVLVTALITSYYPQYFAVFVLFSLNTVYATFSIWIFDHFHFWLPVLAPIVVTVFTYITFLSFQLTLKDYLNIQLEKEKDFMLDVEQLKTNFLSLISHDLKTPIAKIQGICDRLMTEHADAKLQSDLSVLRDTSAELNRYIRTILQIAKVESRDFRIHPDTVDLNDLTETVVNQLQPLAKAKNVEITVDLEPMFLVEVDPLLIQEVILNLVENAVKYTPSGGLVRVQTREVDDQIILMVEDSGPGIPSAEQYRIFEKFYRGESGKNQARGSGLGLYLVKYFIELHAGKVLLESTLGKGTRIGFSLPIQEAEKVEDTVVEGNLDETRT